MVKSIIKEVFIIILLVIAILLILGIIFYDDRPSARKIPTAVAEYELAADIQNEMQETIDAAEAQNIIQTYRVTKKDLDVDRKAGEYDRGKVNPFDRSSTGTNTSNTTGSSSSSSDKPDGQGSFLNTVK